MRSRKLAKYKLDQLRAEELQRICWQYRSMIEEMDALATTSPNMDGQPRGSETSDPTHDAAVRRERYARRVSAIQKCARLAGGPNERGLLIAVTTRGSSYEWARLRGLVYCGRQQFYEMRRHFLWLLDRLV